MQKILMLFCLHVFYDLRVACCFFTLSCLNLLCLHVFFSPPPLIFLVVHPLVTHNMCYYHSIQGLKVTMKKTPSAFKLCGDLKAKNEQVTKDAVVLYSGIA